MKLNLIAVLLFSLTATLFGQGIEFLHDKTYDVGIISQGDLIEGEIAFVNKSPVTVQIKDIKTSCGCTAIKPDQRSYAPGETARIPFTVETKNFNVPIRKSIQIIFDNEAVPNETIMVQAKVKTDLSISPKYINLANLTVNSDTTVTEFFEISNTSDKAITIKRISANQPTYVLTPDKVEIPAGKSHLIRFDFTPDKVGRFNGRILVESDHARQSNLELRVFVNVRDVVRESE